MEGYDPWSDFRSRFEGQDGRIGVVEQAVSKEREERAVLAQQMAVLAQQMSDLGDSFKSVRNALYAAAGMIVVAAVAVLIFAGHR